MSIGLPDSKACKEWHCYIIIITIIINCKSYYFDLSHTIENTSENSARHGFVVIDDNEAAVVATQQSANQAVHEAFPPLHCNIDKSNNTHVGDTVSMGKRFWHI
jgi:hypothetical protein